MHGPRSPSPQFQSPPHIEQIAPTLHSSLCPSKAKAMQVAAFDHTLGDTDTPKLSLMYCQLNCHSLQFIRYPVRVRPAHIRRLRSCVQATDTEANVIVKYSLHNKS